MASTPRTPAPAIRSTSFRTPRRPALPGTPENIVMLTADAFGVLPPISRLSPEQAMYHFLSGYTARVAGTEKGVTEPQATFSTCFGAPFMPRHPTVYAKMLGEKMARQNVKCWLVNTGWSGGGFGVGERMSIRHTRAMARARSRRHAGLGRVGDRSALRHASSECLPGRTGRRAQSKEHLEGQEGLRQRSRATSPSASRRTSSSSKAMSMAR